MTNSFLTFLGPQRNIHLPHLEDLIFTDGYAGARLAYAILTECGELLAGHASPALNLSVKWDGAPALVFGRDPTDGRFFVATKGAFNRIPKLAKTHDEIDALYPGSVRMILHQAFDHLWKLLPTTILQGDVLFGPEDIHTRDIDGQTHVCFQTNILLYAATGAVGETIRRASFGIALHTEYEGDSIATARAIPLTPMTFARLRKPEEVWVVNAAYDDVTGVASFAHPEAKEELAIALTVAERVVRVIMQPADFDVAQQLCAPALQVINRGIRTRTRWTPNDFTAEIARTVSLVDGAATRRLFVLHTALQSAKHIIIESLAEAVTIDAYVRDDHDHLIPTGPEGFVASMHGKLVKLVNRDEFSYRNFTSPKAWQAIPK